MGPGEEEIIMYGQRFWPVIDNRMGVYDYPTLCLAIWHFQGHPRWLSMSRRTKNLVPQVIMLRLGTKWLYQLAQQGELGEQNTATAQNVLHQNRHTRRRVCRQPDRRMSASCDTKDRGTQLQVGNKRDGEVAPGPHGTRLLPGPKLPGKVGTGIGTGQSGLIGKEGEPGACQLRYNRRKQGKAGRAGTG